MSSNDQSSKRGTTKKVSRSKNLLESLRELGTSQRDGGNQDKGLLKENPEEFVRQLFGVDRPAVSASGEIQPGQSLDLEEVLAAEKKENKVLRQRLAQEQSLREQEKVLFEKKSQELKVELHALTEEVKTLAKTTQGLSSEVEIAASQAPANPGVYHVIFFEKLREFIESFRKKIENASIWLQSYNQRAKRKHTFWGQVSKAGSKRLLSPEDYLQRSAG